MCLLNDGHFDVVEMQRFVADYLKRPGNPVTLAVTPGTRHDPMSQQGAAVFLDALKQLLTTT